MTDTAPQPIDRLTELAAEQAGLVARRQLTEIGVRRSDVRSELRGRRWSRPFPGVFATFTGPLTDEARVWAALLYAGPLAAASHETAAWLHGLRADLPVRLDVCVPHGHRHRRSRDGVRVRQSRHFAKRQQPARQPPRTTLEDTVLDLSDAARAALPVIDLVLRVCQQRRTTAARLALAMRSRSRLRWRALLRDLLSDVRDGVQSPLERSFHRDVERAHGLPRGQRNHPEGRAGHRRYRDVRYRRWRVVVELDGRAAHPGDQREYDDLRDNEVTEREERTLRYGWRSVVVTPCATAAQVGRVFTQQGWTGTPTRCGPSCTVLD
jgi:hypothetical protein